MNDEILEDNIIELKEAFDLFDKDRDGFISINELAELFKLLGFYTTDNEFQEMRNKMDLNQNENIDFNEYLSIAIKEIKNNNEDIDYMEAFKAFDRDGDGFISAKELKFVMENLGETMTIEEAEEMLKEADLDEDNRMNYEEFLRMMNEK